MRSPSLDAAQVQYITEVERECREARNGHSELASRIPFGEFRSRVGVLMREMFTRVNPTGELFLPLVDMEIGMLDRHMRGPEFAQRYSELHGDNKNRAGESIASEYAHFRSGNIPGTEIVSPESFDEAINLIFDDIFASMIDRGIIQQPEKTVCVFLWRAACAAIESAHRHGLRNTLHLGLTRNEHTGAASMYYDGDNVVKRVTPDTELVIVDPMFATGGSIMRVIDYLKRFGADPQNMSIASVVSAAPGVARVLDKYPVRHAVVGKSDGYLQSNIFIGAPGAGDAGDKAARAFVEQKISNWERKLRMMSTQDAQAFRRRMAETLMVA